MAIPFRQIAQQQYAAQVGLVAVRKALLEEGAKEVAPDMFECTSADFALIEARVLDAMKEEP